MGVQCRTWCDVLETNAQTLARPVLLLAPAQIEDIEDPWEVEADYERVEFSPSIAAQAVTCPMLLLSPASTVICGLLRNSAPKDMHTEVERMTRAAAPDEPKRQRKTGTGKAAAAKPKQTRARAKAGA